MRKISFYFIAMFLLAAFVVSMGGCGGSSNKFSGSNGNSGNGSVEQSLSNALTGSEMASVMHGSEWVDLINEFEEAGSGDKMNPQEWVYCVTDEEAQKLRAKYADDSFDLAVLEALLFDADRIKTAYDEEHIVLLIYPDEDFINRALVAAGLEGNYVKESDANGEKRLEMYAFAKRTINDRTFSFSYQAFKSDEAVITSVRTSEDEEVTAESVNSVVEVSASNPTVNASDTTEDDVFFSIDRWRDYYNWCASLTDMANETNVEADAIELRAAADENELTRVANAQITIRDFPVYKNNDYRPWGGAIGGDAADIRRKNQVSITIYACHSYRYGSDYYLVQTNATTSPLNYKDKMDHEFTWYNGGGEYGRYGYTNLVNYLSGYTGSFGFESHLCSIVSGRETSNLSTTEVGLIDYIPTNVPKNTTVTKGVDWNIGGSIGIGKDGPTASLSFGVTHSSSETWTTSDWSVVASPLTVTDNSVRWTADVTGPSDSEKWHENSRGWYMGISSTSASRDPLSFKSEWIWQVDKSIWSKQDTNTMLMRIKFFWEEGFCYGAGIGFYAGGFRSFSWAGGRRYPQYNLSDMVNLDMPRHSWVSQKIFDVGVNGASGLGFNILSEGRWEVSTNVDWITFTRTNGDATGENEYPVRFEVAENNTGRARDAEIKFVAYVGDKITEESTIYVNQTGR